MAKNTLSLSSADVERESATVDGRPLLGAEGWEYLDASTDHLTHAIHRYSSKFIPQIAARCISALSAQGDTIVDPFCGSGTTLLEGALQRRHTIGVDLNPLACRISTVKTTPIESGIGARELAAHRALAADFTASVRFGTQPLFHSATSQIDHRFADQLRKWFQPQVLNELWVIAQAIKAVESRAVRQLCEISFSDVLRRLSNAHAGYPNVMFDRDAPQKGKALETYLRRLDLNAAAVATLDARPELLTHSPDVVVADAGKLPIATSSVDLVMTHPPYIASVPYAEYLLLSMLWFEIDPREFDSRVFGGRRMRSDVVARFMTGMGASFEEIRRILRRGCYAVVVIGNPVVRGEKIDLASDFISLARGLDLRLREAIVRSKVNMRANKMRDEWILVFEAA